ncbi:MAG: Rpn family recombination-promoting nuclease/putative transposase [Cyanobacteria bacterium RI_101]|nr:Rpn family recombination-promoting nuclease/putative transposase [Cyanobacteria bacterium RI_101]
MFDNVCKYLAETFSEDYAAWLLGKPVALTTLSPKELSLEPIRADSLILEQSDDLVLHLEFQTEPDETMGFRMLDYRVRVHRRFPNKTMRQVVVYLKKTGSPLVYQDTFQLGETRHRYCVIRLWEESAAPFLNSPGLLPLAVLTQSQDPTERLREVALALGTIEDRRAKANLTTASAVFGGLLVKPELIRTILQSDIMKESAIYQEILQEGEQRGLLQGKREGKLEVAQRLLERGLPISEVISITGLSAGDLKHIASKRQ